MKPLKHQVTEITVAYKPKRAFSNQPLFKCSSDASIYLLEGFDLNTIAMQEQFVVLYLNQANHILGLFKASKGGISGTVADYRIILSIALKTLSTSIIIAHNHPSGNINPSRNDIELTEQIQQACKLMNIRLLDHLIFAPTTQFYSFADEGLL